MRGAVAWRARLLKAFCAVLAVIHPSTSAAGINLSPILTPPYGLGTGVNGGYINQVLADPRRGGFYVCGIFGGLQAVSVSGIAHIGSDGRLVTALAGSSPAAGSISGTCASVALDPADPDAVYVGLEPFGTCGGGELGAYAGLCKWSWAAQEWTLVAMASGQTTASIRAIAAVGGVVWFGGDFTNGCSSPFAGLIASPSFCKIVGGVVSAAYSMDGTGNAGVKPLSFGNPTTVRAILPTGATTPAWLAASGADVSTAAFVCGDFASAGGQPSLGFLFIAANDARNPNFTAFRPLMVNASGAVVQAVSAACMGAVPLDGGQRIAFAGSFAKAAGGAVAASKLVAFDGSGLRPLAPSLLPDTSSVTAVAVEPVSGWLYAALDAPSVGTTNYGYMLRLNISNGAVARLLPPSGVPGVQVQPSSIGGGFGSAPRPCAGTRATISCRPRSLAALPDGRIVVAGSFETVDGSTVVNGLAFWAGGQWTPFGTAGAGANDNVYAAAPLSLSSSGGSGPSQGSGSALLIGGSFSFVGSTPAVAAAIVVPASADGTSPGFAAPLSPGLAPAQQGATAVRAFLPVSGAAAGTAGAGVYMTGAFSSGSGSGTGFSFCSTNATAPPLAPGVPALACTALVDTSTGEEGLAGSFGAGSGVALAHLLGEVYISGPFATCGGVSGTAVVCRWQAQLRRYAALSMANAAGTGTRLSSGSSVVALAADAARGVMYIGGSFMNLNDGTPVNNIVAWDAGSSAFIPLRSSPTATGAPGLLGGSVSALFILSDVLYAGGSFLQTGDLAMLVTHAAGYSLANCTWFPLLFPGAARAGGGGVGGQVQTIAGDAVSGAVFLGGSISGCYLAGFRGIAAQCGQLVRYDASVGLSDLLGPLNLPLTNNMLYSLAVESGKRSLLLGGTLGVSPSGIPLNNIAALDISGPVPTPLPASSSPRPTPSLPSTPLPTPSRSVNPSVVYMTALPSQPPPLAPALALRLHLHQQLRRRRLHHRQDCKRRPRPPPRATFLPLPLPLLLSCAWEPCCS